MWAVMGLNTEGIVLVYMRLLNEGTEVYRPVHAQRLEGERVQILAPEEYDPDDEEWEFKPGTVVRIDQRELEGELVSVAVVG